MSENGEIYTAGKNFTLLPAVTAVTNLTSGPRNHILELSYLIKALNIVMMNRTEE